MKPVVGASYSPDGQTIATTEKGQVELFSTASKTRIKHVFQEGASHATFSQDGQRLLSYGSKSARVWHVTTPGAVSRSRLKLPASVTGGALSPDGSTFAVAAGATADLRQCQQRPPLRAPGAERGESRPVLANRRRGRDCRSRWHRSDLEHRRRRPPLFDPCERRASDRGRVQPGRRLAAHPRHPGRHTNLDTQRHARSRRSSSDRSRRSPPPTSRVTGNTS